MVGITLAYAGLVGLRTLNQHRTNDWQLSWSEEQNDIGPTHLSTSGQENCQQNTQRLPNEWLLPKGLVFCAQLMQIGYAVGSCYKKWKM